MEDSRTAKRIVLTTIASAMGAAAAAGAIAGAVLGAFAPIANELFTNSITGEADRTARALIDGFEAKVEALQVQTRGRFPKSAHPLDGIARAFRVGIRT